MSKRKEKEHFGGSSVIIALPSLIMFFVFWIAIYLMFVRGPSLGSFLAACCCSPFYVAYAIANPM